MIEKKYLKLNDITAYKMAFKLSNYVWDIVVKWNVFTKSIIGVQFVKAVDSVSANIAEGFGRYNKKDKVKFFRISNGSVLESLDWNEKSRIRNLLKPEEYDRILNELKSLPKEINHLIKFTNEKLTE
ncbi:MAG TPA: four helix bundle protein [Ignavibacteriaceae bacterium]|nr:four helix bundle protein [Ignavibacteriaceae bacterium]